MYFLTNKENIIIAASNDILEEFGFKEFCSLATALNENIISLDKEEQTLQIDKNALYSYNTHKMNSLLGEVTLYNIYKYEEEPLELKTSLEAEKKDEISETLLKTDENIQDKESKETIIPLKEETKTNETLDIPFKIEENIVEEKTTTPQTHLKSTEEIKEQEAKETTIPFQEETKDNETLDIPLQLDENIKEENTQSITKEENTKTLDIPLTLSENTTEENEKLNLKEEKEELSEVSLLNTTDLELKPSTINELEVKELKIPEIPKEALELDIKNTENMSKEIPIEEAQKITLEAEEDKKTTLQNLSLEKEESETLQTIATPEKEYQKAEIPTKESTPSQEGSFIEPIGEISHLLEEQKEPKKSFFSKKLFSWGKKKKEEPIQEEENLIKFPETDDFIEKEEINKPTPKEERFAQLEKALLQDEQEDLEKKQDELDTKSTKTTFKSLNLGENAKKLNIDVPSYKVLVESYIEEIKTHLGKLEEGNLEVKNMLIEAGEFLSLQELTKYLKELSPNNNNTEAIKNITTALTFLETEVIASSKNNQKTTEESFLEEKEENSQTIMPQQEAIPLSNNTNTIEEQKEVEELSLSLSKETETIEKEEKEKPIEETEEKSTQTIAEDAIELTESSYLLDKIEPQKLSIDLEKISQELNLPKDLIYEFLKDFLTQMKEHLDIFINHYKNKDLEKLYETAHMLKGAANNLRLIPIGETLLKIQKENNLDNIALLIKKFAAQTKGLEDELEKIGV